MKPRLQQNQHSKCNQYSRLTRYLSVFISLFFFVIFTCSIYATDQTSQQETSKPLNTQSENSSVVTEIESTEGSPKKTFENGGGSFYQDFKRQQGQTLKNTQRTADLYQKNVSVRLHRFSGYVDKFFANENYVQESYDSRLRLSLASQYQQYSDLSLKPRINLSLALPNTKNRWRLSFQSDEIVEGGESSASDLNTDEANNSFTTALGLTLKTSKRTDIRTNVGIKFNTPIDPFTRLRIRRSFWVEDIEIRLAEVFEWRDTRGKTARSQLEIEYPINGNYFFRSQTESTYWDIDSYWSSSQSFTLYDQASSKSVIAYAIGVNFQDEDEFHLRKKDQVNDYWIETRYRKRFYKDWFYYQVSPGLVRPREYQFETLPRLELRIEAVYGLLTGQ